MSNKKSVVSLEELALDNINDTLQEILSELKEIKDLLQKKKNSF